ncbi:MAG: sigma-70 family RNA polymerase sigma factor, partial [Bacteroidota bacterium]
VFFQLANRWDPNEPIEQASAWMFRVARNKITDTYRKKKAVPFSQYHQDGEEGKELYFFEHLPDFSQSPDQIYWQNWVMEAIEEAVEALPTKQKEVFIWHELEDRSFKEIAQMTGELVPTLISRKRYAVRTLRARLLEMYESLWAD